MSQVPFIRPSRRRRPKYEYEPCIGVKTDFETLLQRFSAFGTVRYEKFAECWRDLNMSSYCAGRQTQREAREFVEDCFLIACQYWLPPSSFLIRAGALYLLYGLYYFQLVMPKVKIRVTHQQWPKILEFQEEAREQQHHDLDYIFHKMLLEKAFVFVATDDDMYPKQKGMVETKVIPESMKDETGLLDEVFSHSAVNQLSLVHDQYQKMKVALNSNDTGQPDTSLNIVHTDLIDSINKTLENHKSRQTTVTSKFSQNSTQDSDSEGEDPTSKLPGLLSVKKHLKLKAFEHGISGSKTKNEKEDGDKCYRLSMSGKLSQAQGRRLRRKPAEGLFDRDENEDAPVVVPDVQELFCMPNIPLIDDSTTAVTTVGSDREENTESDNDTETETTRPESHTDSTQPAPEPAPVSHNQVKRKPDSTHTKQSKSKKMKLKHDVDDKDAAASKNVSHTETLPSGKEFKCPETKCTPQSNVKGGTRKTCMPKLATVTGETDCGSGKDKGKELTAQEKLQMKLTQKRKEARLKSLQTKPTVSTGAKKTKGNKKKK